MCNPCEDYKVCKPLVTDEICIKIKQCCDTEKTIWRAIDVTPCATIVAKNTSNCLMRLKLYKPKNKCEAINVPPNEEISFTISAIKKLQVICYEINSDDTCKGSITMRLHYACGASKCKHSNCNEKWTKDICCNHSRHRDENVLWNS